MRFYNKDGELNERSYPRTYGQEVEIALSALDCVLNGEKAIYVSSDLTTGKRLFSLLREFRVQGSSELKEKLGEQRYRSLLIDPNAAAANTFAHQLRARLRRDELVITPAPFAAPGWSQREYLAYWETFIRTRVKAVFFNDAWQYSNGCTFEFAVAQDAGLPTLDAEGRPLDLETGIEMVSEAVRELEGDAIEPAGLRANLTSLRTLRESPRHGE